MDDDEEDYLDLDDLDDDDDYLVLIMDDYLDDLDDDYDYLVLIMPARQVGWWQLRIISSHNLPLQPINAFQFRILSRNLSKC